MQLQTLCAHVSNLAQHFLFIGKWNQQAPSISVGVMAELVAIGCGDEPNLSFCSRYIMDS